MERDEFLIIFFEALESATCFYLHTAFDTHSSSPSKVAPFVSELKPTSWNLHRLV